MDFRSSEHPISWFRDRYREGNLEIRPSYQRKPVWAARQKCYLIESILMGLPVPEIYIQSSTSPEGDTRYAIVDGQQRIRTVLQFVGSEMDASEAEYNKFALDQLEATSSWKDIAFSDLSDAQKRVFYGYPFIVRYLNTDNEEDVRDLFQRLNKFLTPLKAQELRNATYSGPFAKLAEELADNRFWAENRIVSPTSIRRMGDVEFVSELLIGILHGPQGGSSRIVDAYYKQYEDYEYEFPDQTRIRRLFERTLDISQRILPDIKETRWSNISDFYTLFVALAFTLRNNSIIEGQIEDLGQRLRQFGASVDVRRSDEDAQATSEVTTYVGAVEKGANDKKRRADRHIVLLNIINSVLPE